MTYSDFYNKFPKKFSRKSFKNKHGERFYVIRTKTKPELYLITGDEYDWEMTPLFSDKFDIYTKQEVRELGKALQELSK